MAKQEKKKRRNKREHLKDFYQDVSGKYVYGGAMYACDLPPARRKQILTQMWLSVAGAAAALILGGCIPAAGMSDGFLVIPFYLGAIISTGMACWTLWELTAGGDPMREYIYTACLEKLPKRCEFGMVFAGLCLVGLLLHLFIYRMEDASLWATVLFMVIQIGTIGALFLVKKLLQVLHWTKK